MMLEKRANDRLQTPMEVAEALVEWTQQPIEVPPSHEMPDLCPAVLSLMGQPEKLRASSVANRSRVLLPTGGGGQSSSKFAPTNYGATTPPPGPQSVGLLGGSDTTPRVEATTPMPVPHSRRPVSMESIDLLAQQSLTQMIADSSTNLLPSSHGAGTANRSWLWVALLVGAVVFGVTVAAALHFAK
jgi:hypothetical protein